MNDLDFEFAIRQDVRNNPIVRELDRERVREMWRWSAVVFGFALVLVFTAIQHFQVLRQGYLLEDMRRQLVEQQQEHRHLLLERSSLLAPQRIEKIAMGQLGLVEPGAASTIVIERVDANAVPAHGVVASR